MHRVGIRVLSIRGCSKARRQVLLPLVLLPTYEEWVQNLAFKRVPDFFRVSMASTGRFTDIDRFKKIARLSLWRMHQTFTQTGRRVGDTTSLYPRRRALARDSPEAPAPARFRKPPSLLLPPAATVSASTPLLPAAAAPGCGATAWGARGPAAPCPPLHFAAYRTHRVISNAMITAARSVYRAVAAAGDRGAAPWA